MGVCFHEGMIHMLLCCLPIKSYSSIEMGQSKSKEHTVSTVDLKAKPQLEELGVQASAIEISKAVVDFNLGEQPCPLKVAVNDQFDIINKSNAKIRFNFEPSFPKEFQLIFSPSAGTIDKNKSKTIKAKLIVNSKLNINHKVTLKIDDEVSHFLTVRIRCETGVFGVEPSSLEMEMDGGHQVPSILVAMKRAIIEYGGLKQEGIFRLAGEQTEIKRIKEIMNKKEFVTSNDVNTIASLLKIWYRELPTPILNCVPQESIFHSNDVAGCVKAFESLPDLQKTLLSWLMDVLIMTAQNSKENKMTSQNLSIVVAPNLYDVATSNPMEGLVMSQKCVQFLHNVLNYRIQHMS